MTTEARLREKRIWKKNTVKFATWNILSWSGRNREILMELHNFKIHFCAISENKKKGKGTVCIDDHILAYSGKQQEERAHAGVGLLIHKKYMNNIDNIEYTSERIIQVTLKFPQAKWYLLSLYAPDISKPKEQREEFYVDLQNAIDQKPRDALLITMGDMNATVGNMSIPGGK
jgi:exonuclease III